MNSLPLAGFAVVCACLLWYMVEDFMIEGGA